jgi:hypothetical protein
VVTFGGSLSGKSAPHSALSAPSVVFRSFEYIIDIYA